MRISMVDYQLITRRFVCLVVVERGIILDIAPMLYKFKGSKLITLVSWVRKNVGYYKMVELGESPNG